MRQKSVNVKWVVPPVTVNFLLTYRENGGNSYCSGCGILQPTEPMTETWSCGQGILIRDQNIARCPTRDMSHP